MKEKFMIVQNFVQLPNWDSPGTHIEKCWVELERAYDTAFDAVKVKNSKINAEFYVVIKYYE